MNAHGIVRSALRHPKDRSQPPWAGRLPIGRWGMVFLAVSWAGWVCPVGGQQDFEGPNRGVDIGLFIQPFLDNPLRAPEAFDTLAEGWRDSFTIMLLEVSQFAEPDVREDIFGFLTEMTGRPFGLGPIFLNPADYQWAWQKAAGTHPDYANFKAALYEQESPAARGFFAKGRPATVRLEEILWRDPEGEPPATLVHPAMVPADQAGFLPANSPILGIEIDGEARAYLRQTLLQHTLLTDTVGGQEVAGIYCFLSGAVAFYRTSLDKAGYKLEASEFVYRSATLLCDQATHSLWSPFTGKPVVGPLVAQGIELEPIPVVGTSWGAWRQNHPHTLILSRKDISPPSPRQNALRRAYLATAQLLFPVPKLDSRLANKAPILGLRLRGSNQAALALNLGFLRRHRAFNGRLGETRFVVLTDRNGGSRAYITHGQTFSHWDERRRAVDTHREVWLVTEEALKHADGTLLLRMPEQQAFWFAWQAALPNTRLVR